MKERLLNIYEKTGKKMKFSQMLRASAKIFLTLGLTVLIPYLLSKLESSVFHNAKLRVFSLASSRGTMKEEEEK